MVVWSGWFLLARVTVYESSAAARLEVGEAAHVLEAPFDADVSAVAIELGQEVATGDVLLVLDATALELRLAEVVARHRALETQLSARNAGIDAEGTALQHEEGASVAAQAERRALLREATAAATLARDEADRTAELADQGVASATDRDRTAAVAAQAEAARDSARKAVGLAYSEGSRAVSDRVVSREHRREEAARLLGEVEATAAEIARLERDIGRHRIRSPADGVVGEIARVKVGDHVSLGDSIGSIVPVGGELRVVAQFSPEAALGRIQPGQWARLRLDGFPWTEWGSLDAEVVRVAREPRQGRIEVEFGVETAGSGIPIQHGLTGAIDVAVERVSPAVLALRAAGGPVGRAAR
jgi:membrane fusion protein (multidrug efflux system)